MRAAWPSVLLHRLRPSPVLALSTSLFLAGAANLLTFLGIYWLVLTRIGAGPESDAFFVALVLPQLMASIVQSGLAHVLIPILSIGTADNRARDGWTFFQVCLLVFGAMALLLGATAPIWVQWLAPGFADEYLRLTVTLVRITLVAMFLTVLNGVCIAVHHANRRFIYVEFAESTAGCLAIILLLSTIGELGVLAAAWAVTLRYGASVCLLLPGLGPYRAPKFNRDSIRTTWSRAWPLFAGSSYTKLDIAVDRMLASFAAPGLLSLLNIGQQIFGAGNLLIYKASSAPVFPRLSQLAAAGEWAEFRGLYRSRLAANAAISLAVILVLIAVGQPLLAWILDHGRFESGNIRTLWTIMIAMSGLLVGGSVGQIAAMAFYATGDTRSPTIIGVIGFSIGIVLKVGGFFLFGVIGIAAATTIYYLFNVVILETVLTWKIRKALTRHDSIAP